MPLKPVSMARTIQEKQDAGRPMTEGRPIDEMEDYPYGLTIHLSTDEIKKLGLNRGQLDPGDKVRGVFTGMVTHAQASMVNGLARHEATVQIQSLGLEEEPQEDERAQIMYGASP